MIVAECVDLCSLVLEREHIKAENQRLAYFDPLTGLGNRANFLRTLETVADRSAGPIAILLVDIDHLGRLNDAFGHAAGDKLIIKVARMIAAICGPEAVFRVDADEFAIVIKENPDAELSRISGEILRSMEQRSDWAGEHDTPISVSCGGAVSDASRPPRRANFSATGKSGAATCQADGARKLQSVHRGPRRSPYAAVSDPAIREKRIG